MKTSELTGAVLAYWVAKAEGLENARIVEGECMCVHHHEPDDDGWWTGYDPHEDWVLAGPIIERNKIDLMHVEYRGLVMGGKPDEPWNAMMQNLSIDNPDWDSMSGPTALIASMRAYVGSKFGENLPEGENV